MVDKVCISLLCKFQAEGTPLMHTFFSNEIHVFHTLDSMERLPLVLTHRSVTYIKRMEHLVAYE